MKGARNFLFNRQVTHAKILCIQNTIADARNRRSNEKTIKTKYSHYTCYLNRKFDSDFATIHIEVVGKVIRGNKYLHLTMAFQKLHSSVGLLTLPES